MCAWLFIALLLEAHFELLDKYWIVLKSTKSERVVLIIFAPLRCDCVKAGDAVLNSDERWTMSRISMLKSHNLPEHYPPLTLRINQGNAMAVNEFTSEQLWNFYRL